MADSHPLDIVLWAPLPPPMGGISRWAMRYLKVAARHDMRVRTVNIAPPTQDFDEASRLRPTRVRKAGVALAELTRTLRASRPDVCHVNTTLFWATPRDAAALLLCRTMRVPTVLQIHASNQIIAWREGLSAAKRFALDRSLSAADCIVVLSRELEVYLAEALPTVRIVRVGNMVSLEPKIDESITRGGVLPPSSSPFRVLFVGALTPKKGVAELAEAVARLEGVELIVIGSPGQAIDSNEAERMMAGLDALRASDRLVEMGQRTPEEVLAAYSEVDCFALASHREGMPNVLLEAMAAGLPCVTTPVGGIPEVVDEQCAILVPVGDVEALSEAIDTLRGDAELRTVLGEKARRRIQEEYSTDTVMATFRALYASLSDGDGRA